MTTAQGRVECIVAGFAPPRLLAARDVTTPQVAEILSEIAMTANAVDAMCSSANEAYSDPDAVEALLRAMRVMVCKCGLLADLGASKLGHYQVIGGAEAWMVPRGLLERFTAVADRAE